MENITLKGENDSIELYILETTRLGAVDYALASDTVTGDGECYIMKDVSAPEDEESVYEIVEDEHELDYLAGVFAELLEDTDISF